MLVAVAGGSAEAAHLITSSDIQDGTIKGKDIHSGTISLSKLTPSVQKAIKNGAGCPRREQRQDRPYDVTHGIVRYDDDAGDGSGPYGLNGASWDTVVNDHGDDTVSGVYVTDGFACASSPLSAWLNSLTVEANGHQPRLFGLGS